MEDPAEDLIACFNCLSVNTHNTIVRNYIYTLNIDINLKQYLINLVNNDNYNSYLEIYNICVENNIELPPI